MTTSATLDSSEVRLEPGGEVLVPVTIRNTGSIVEGYRLEVLGAPGQWATVEPAVVDGLYPDTATTATVTFRPPRDGSVLAGTFDFGIRVIPLERPDEAVTPEGVVEVLPYLDTTAELVPRTSHGRRGAQHQVAVDNRGNVPVTVTLSGSDENQALDYTVRPPQLTVEPGQAAFAKVRVRPVKTFWRGADVTHPFTVTVSTETTTPVALDGTHLQSAILPKWTLKALIAALAALALLLLLWFTLLRPVIASAAQAAVADEREEAIEAAQAAEEAAVAAQQAASGAQGAADTAANSAQAAEQRVADVEQVVQGFVAPSEIVTPMSQRLQSSTPAGSTVTVPLPNPGDDVTLRVRDWVFSNPQGDFGRVVIDHDGAVVFDLALENFRAVDFHFNEPLVLAPGQQLRMTVTCREAGAPPALDPPPTRCDTSVLLGGSSAVPAPEPEPATDGG